ncbi:MAG TPA: TfoX/Sxy family DNA transformation protein [Candidatus Dormibacteraeota bacterium]|nr:TfoX/Sxy family DNA transformation protein [Candidatus Dormibacteraeota bacterium]
MGDDQPVALERMKNLGPVSAARLRVAGIETPEELRRLGAVEAYARLKRTFPAETTHTTLYMLHGAVTGVRWYGLSEESRAALRDAAARRL